MIVAGAGRILRRVGRGALVMVGGLLGAAWLLVPLITDLKYVGQTQLNPTEFQSFGARRELEWLLRGQLFDDNRPNFPLLTMLALLGVVIAVAASDAMPRPE